MYYNILFPNLGILLFERSEKSKIPKEIKQSTHLDNQTRTALHTIAVEQKQKLSDLILNKIVIVDCRKFDAFGRLLSYLYIFDKDKKTIR